MSGMGHTTQCIEGCMLHAVDDAAAADDDDWAGSQTGSAYIRSRLQARLSGLCCGFALPFVPNSHVTKHGSLRKACSHKTGVWRSYVFFIEGGRGRWADQIGGKIWRKTCPGPSTMLRVFEPSS